jgi:phosphoribosylanthranilate isomerase
MTEVKICGIRDPAAMDAAAGADYAGFVFFARSPRNIAPWDAAALAARHPNGPTSVALFVNPPDAELETVLAGFRPGILQVHAAPERAAAIQAKYGLPVWHVVGVESAADLPATAAGVTRLLLDRKPLPTDTRPGGNAEPFDWSALLGWSAPLPWILAGGLTPENVVDAIRQTGATAVDVSSGVESSSGVKDPARIAAFIAAVRGV